MTSNRPACLLSFLILWSSLAFSASVDLPSWELFRGADPASGTWERIDMPSSITTGGRNGTVWLRTRIPSPQDAAAYFLLGRLDAAAEIFVNGSLIARRGVFPPRYAVATNEPGVYLLPRGLLRGDGNDELTVRLFVPSSMLSIPRLSLIGEQEAAYQRNVIVFFNLRLYVIMAALCGFIGLYFLLLWTSKRDDFANLWYAVCSLSIAYYFADMGSSVSFLPYALNRALAKTGLTISMSGLIAFFVVHFKVPRPAWLAPVLVGVPLAMLVAYLVGRGDFTTVNLIFTIGLLYVQIAIFFILFVTVRSVVRGNREAIPLLVGVGLGLAFGTYDVVHKATGIEPFAWLQGVGFFCLNLSLFVTQTVKAARFHRDLERYAADVEAKTAQLGSYVDQIGSVADSVTAIAERVDADAEGAAGSVEKLAAAAERIGENAEKQASASKETAEAVVRLVEALRSIRRGVDSQATGIADASAAIKVIATESESVAASIGKTADFARSLDGTAEKGRAAVAGLADAIQRIKDTSRSISLIVDAVEDFAERTNLLAMNAAIEAAHSGAAGRGFAVIAAEIKGLAAASAERAAKIRESVAEIGVRIGNGVESSERVRDALSSVAEGAKTASSGISEISGALASQHDAAERLRSSLYALAEAAETIKGEAEQRDQDAQKVRSKISDLASFASELQESIVGIVEENAAIAESMRRLALISRDGKDAALGLRRMLERRD